jgi:hypothetical protein
VLTCNECRTTCGATLLAIIVGEQHPFFGNAVNAGRLVAHHAHVVSADIRPAHIVPPDHQNVRLLGLLRRCGANRPQLRYDTFFGPRLQLRDLLLNLRLIRLYLRFSLLIDRDLEC